MIPTIKNCTTTWRWSPVTKSGALGAALGFGLLYAWMETLAVRLAVLSGRGPSPGAPLFLACLAIALFVAGASSLQPFIERFRRELSIAGCALMSSTPVALAAAGFLPSAPSSVLSSTAVAFGGLGTALLLCRWGILLSTLEPDDIAVAFAANGAGGDRFLLLETGRAEMDVEIDQSRADDQPGCVNAFSI